MRVIVDTSILVGLVNPRDIWHAPSLALVNQLVLVNAELVYFDCVVSEAISTICRRLHEKGRTAEISALLRGLETLAPFDQITWIFPDVPRLYPQVVGLVEESSGALSFNDALIAVAARDRSLGLVATFDADFDRVAWVRRLATPSDVTS